MKVSIKKISILVMLGFMLNSTTNCMHKPQTAEGRAPKPESKDSQQKPNKIITSRQIDQIYQDLTIIPPGANYSDALADIKSILKGLPDSK